jgi:hypothetical protein
VTDSQHQPTLMGHVGIVVPAVDMLSSTQKEMVIKNSGLFYAAARRFRVSML